MKVLESEGVEAAATLLVGKIFSEPGTRDLAEVTIRKLAQLPRDTWLNFIDPGPELEIAPLLAEVAVPTLVAYGTEDRVFPVAQGRYIASHIAGAQFYAFEGKGHLPIYTATREFCDVLRKFVRTGIVPELVAAT
jgi:pimeloyl-ACP methyl ester carboxylesterase